MALGYTWVDEGLDSVLDSKRNEKVWLEQIKDNTLEIQRTKGYIGGGI